MRLVPLLRLIAASARPGAAAQCPAACRRLAAKAHTGRYFPLRATAHCPAGSQQADAAFCEYVAGLYACIQKGAAAYPGFLTGHAISIAASKRGEAKSVMEHTVAHIRAGLLEALRADRTIPEEAFSPAFPREAFAGFVLDSMLLLLVQGQPDCGVLLEIIRRTVSPQIAAAQAGPLQEPAPGPAGSERF